jgi:hypothetical protein
MYTCIHGATMVRTFLCTIIQEQTENRPTDMYGRYVVATERTHHNNRQVGRTLCPTFRTCLSVCFLSVLCMMFRLLIPLQTDRQTGQACLSCLLV